VDDPAAEEYIPAEHQHLDLTLPSLLLSDMTDQGGDHRQWPREQANSIHAWPLESS
jgi:hypothetical protein